MAKTNEKTIKAFNIDIRRVHRFANNVGAAFRYEHMLHKKQ